MERSYNRNAITNKVSYSLYKKAVWLYIILLIIEGALRKWFLPSLATPLLVIRDPIAIWLVIVWLQRGWIDFSYVKAMMIVCTISFILTLLLGHHNLIVALFGWRIYFFHFPMIFIIGQVLTRDDLLKICRFFLYISIPMTVLIVIQFYSPPTAWVNIGVGGEGTAGFGGVAHYMRPPGIFSFTAGYVAFQGIVGCILLYYLVANNRLKKKQRIPNWILYVTLICYLIAIPTSISRTNFFQTIVFLAFFLLAFVIRKDRRFKIVQTLIIGTIALTILLTTEWIGTNIEVFSMRFEGANQAEGGIDGVLLDRYLGGLLNAFTKTTIPIFGYGMGLGTNVGAYLMGGDMYSFGFNGEIEWERIIGECGFILGVSIIVIRLLLSFALLKRAYLLLRRSDLLPWMLSAGMILTLPQGQWSTPTNLGFCILLSGLLLASIRTSTKPLTPSNMTNTPTE